MTDTIKGKRFDRIKSSKSQCEATLEVTFIRCKAIVQFPVYTARHQNELRMNNSSATSSQLIKIAMKSVPKIYRSKSISNWIKWVIWVIWVV